MWPSEVEILGVGFPKKIPGFNGLMSPAAAIFSSVQPAMIASMSMSFVLLPESAIFEGFGIFRRNRIAFDMESSKACMLRRGKLKSGFES